jgi:hypothetical protein
MEAKEKAFELVEKAKKFAHANLLSFRQESFNISCKGICFICLDEVIRECNRETVEWWVEVKREVAILCANPDEANTGDLKHHIPGTTISSTNLLDVQ